MIYESLAAKQWCRESIGEALRRAHHQARRSASLSLVASDLPRLDCDDLRLQEMFSRANEAFSEVFYLWCFPSPIKREALFS
jgi:hypothetical protein